ncbi:pilus assembly protein TadG-related protein [Chthonobacter rhizosphaerae]|uniref:pilus assembly protein TadG-related protein n=1 Tax=Chthonobacter rhizosphaerae TaxID=2735553 RepID=UPI0015EF6D13|nr:pilus assembly protein TadG-related protein [Chthonobacter rhizosphaerae]
MWIFSVFPRARTFAEAKSGTAAVVFAVALVPVLAMVGASLDYVRASGLRDVIQSAADAAALAVIEAELDGKAADRLGAQVFQANIPAAVRHRILDMDLSVAIITEKNVRSVEVTYTADIETSFLSVASIDTIQLGGSAEARSGLRKYVDIHVLLDTSDSMGLASDLSNREKLKTATKKEKDKGKTSFIEPSCEFACHRRQGDLSTLEIARSEKVELRIDVAKSGIRTVMDLAKDAEKDNTFVRMGLDAFSSTHVHVQFMTRDWSTLAGKIDGVELGLGAAPVPDNECHDNYANTWFDQIVRPYAETVEDSIATAASSNADKKSPSQYIVLVTDGLQSQNCAASKSKQDVFPFRPADCDVLKATGAQIAVIYTEYLVSNSSTYKDHAQHAVEKSKNFIYTDSSKSAGVEENLRECASTDRLFAKGNDPDELEAAFRTIFENIKVTTFLYN